jgi:hypothetical protein
MAASTYRRLVVALLLGGLLLASPPDASGGVILDIGIVSGYVCVLLAIFLYVYPLRGDGLPHSRLLGLSQHRRIGWWMLPAALTHVAVLLVRRAVNVDGWPLGAREMHSPRQPCKRLARR